MEPRDNPTIQAFDEALEGWTDERFLSRVDLRCLAMFNLYLVNLLEQEGIGYDGHSWKEGAPLGVLTVKVTNGGAPYVGFTSARTTMGGIRIFLRKLKEGYVEWRPDRYRS